MAQELNTKMVEALKDETMVRPFDNITVYATGVGGFHKKGEAIEVHKLLAAKMIASGKATEKAPAKSEKDK